MGAKTDTRKKMVSAARDLIRERGLNGTAFSDVLARSDTPRGSVYFHFPGGKTQIAVDAADLHAQVHVELIDELGEKSTSPADLARRYIALGRDGMVASDYSRGCGIAPLSNEGLGNEEVLDASRRGFERMVDQFTSNFARLGLDDAPARELAQSVLAGVEGAMVTARAFRSTAPFDAVQDMVVARAEQLTAHS